jgi:tartrate dehydratase alpha subunit/fumarate hydratase class I-like protein
MEWSGRACCPPVRVGIDIGKNSFHVVGLDRRGAIVL